MKETQSQFKKYVGWSVLIQSILSGALAGVLYFHVIEHYIVTHRPILIIASYEIYRGGGRLGSLTITPK